jgi:hypothetical protein
MKHNFSALIGFYTLFSLIGIVVSDASETVSQIEQKSSEKQAKLQ